MLYRFLKIYVGTLLRLFCHSIHVDNKLLLQTRGPLLIASNHPNSFLDAVIFDILFDLPVTSLARGDAFKSKKIFSLLRRLKMLPVYRLREGAENLNINYQTFDACIDIFRKGEAVLIFSEGLCVNEWHLRPLKKGTARLAFKAWQEDIPVKVLPAGINYSAFRKYGMRINIHFGNFLVAQTFPADQPEGNNYTRFNKKLQTALQQLVYEINPGDHRSLLQHFGNTSLTARILLAPLAACAVVLHAPLFGIGRLMASLASRNNVHFDAILFAVSILGYPFYLLLATIVCYSFYGAAWAIALAFILPLTAFCHARFSIRKGGI